MENIKLLLNYQEKSNLTDPCKWREITLMVISTQIFP